HLAQSILDILVRDTAILVRQSLAETLAHSEHISRNLAMALARDIEQVALPVILASPVFTDEDLIEIIEQGNSAKQVAIARREFVSDAISRVLVDSRNDEAVVTFAANEGAHISATTYQIMID